MIKPMEIARLREDSQLCEEIDYFQKHASELNAAAERYIARTCYPISLSDIVPSGDLLVMSDGKFKPGTIYAFVTNRCGEEGDNKEIQIYDATGTRVIDSVTKFFPDYSVFDPDIRWFWGCLDRDGRGFVDRGWTLNFGPIRGIIGESLDGLNSRENDDYDLEVLDYLGDCYDHAHSVISVTIKNPSRNLFRVNDLGLAKVITETFADKSRERYLPEPVFAPGGGLWSEVFERIRKR